MKYTALKDELIFKIALHVKTLKQASVIRCFLFERAFDNRSSVSTSKICEFTGLPQRTIWQMLNYFVDCEMVGFCLSGREKKWYLSGAAAIGRVVLNPDFYSGKTELLENLE